LRLTNPFRAIFKTFVRASEALVRALRRIRRTWSDLSQHSKHWTFNILIGVSIEGAMLLFHDSRLVVAAQNWILDAVMQGASAYGVGAGKQTPPLTLIDIDESTWRSSLWGGGQPLRAPRMDLLRLVNFALEHRARYVVLDVVMESPADADDGRLAEGMQQIATTLENEKNQHIFFVRSFNAPLDASGYLAPELRRSPLDDVIAAHPLWLHNVAPYFRVSRDGVLRKWDLWRAGCVRDDVAGNGHWVVLPSVQLAIATVAHNEDLGPGNPGKDAASTGRCVVGLSALAQSGPGVPSSQLEQHWADWLRSHPDLTGKSNFELRRGGEIDASSRIFFKFGYPPKSSEVQWIPALEVLKGRTIAGGYDLSSGLVVIGQSFEAVRDEHATPIGTMPGSMVLINSVDSILDIRLLQEPASYIGFFFLIASIVGVGYAFAKFDSFMATIVIFITAFFAGPGLIYILLRAGIWFDLAVPIIGVFAHRMISGLEDYAIGKRTRHKH
jgi:CHASE2 domain-containing sensor protein